MRLAFAIHLAALTAFTLGACGDDPAHVKTIAASDFADPGAGIAFRAPAGARLGEGEGEQIVVLRRGEATLVVSRFDRSGERLPRTGNDLIRASNALKGEYAERKHLTDAGSIGVSLRTVGGRKGLMVSDNNAKHYHLYEYGSEIVIDLVAPAGKWAQAQRAIFDPVFDSLKITKPQD